MTFTDSHNQVLDRMAQLVDELDAHEKYCQGIRTNLRQEMSSLASTPAEIRPVEAASRLRELIGLK